MMLRLIRRKMISYRKEKDYIHNLLMDIKYLKFIPLTKKEKENIKKYCKKHNYVPVYRYYEVLKGNGIYPNPEFITWNNWCRRVLPKYNNIAESYIIDNKNYYDRFFCDLIKMPKTYLRKMNGVFLNQKYQMVNMGSVEHLLPKTDKVIVKKAKNSSCGQGVYLLSPSEAISLIKSNQEDYIIQEVVKNHDCFYVNKLTALSTIRIYTIINGCEVDIAACILRINWRKDSFVDNLSAGGAAVYVNCNGQTNDELFDLKNGFYNSIGNDSFVPFVVPYWDEIVKTVKKLALRMTCSKITAWDIAVTNDGPCLIECNLGTHGINLPQFVSKRPFFNY